MSSTHPPVTIVDEDDHVIGSKDITQAYIDNDIVRISRIFLVNNQGQVLLQKRSDSIERWPGVWDQSAAGHVDKDENYEEAAYREMREELGITGDVVLNKVDYYFADEELDNNERSRRFNAIFVGTYSDELNPDPEEVSGTKWLTLDELDKLIEQDPKQFTPGMLASFIRARPAITKLVSVVK